MLDFNSQTNKDKNADQNLDNRISCWKKLDFKIPKPNKHKNADQNLDNPKQSEKNLISNSYTNKRQIIKPISTESRQRKKVPRFILVTSRSEVADYVIFLTALYDIIFLAPMIIHS
jgi:hypothetical protein